MQCTEKAPVGQGAASGGSYGKSTGNNLPHSYAGGKSSSKPYSLADLYQMRSETRYRLTRFRREGFWLRQQMKDVQDQYADGLFALDAIDGLIVILRAEGEGH
jgi:hypothetical protein